MLKRILRHPWTVFVFARLVAGYLGLVYRTTRWERVEPARYSDLRRSGEAALMCFWHGRIPMAAPAWRDRSLHGSGPAPMTILISNNPDGEVIAQAMKPFGIDVVRGSAGNPKKAAKQKGGAAAFRRMIKEVRAGGWAAITPDGPRGPRMRAAEGIAGLAAATGAPVIPFGWSSSRGRRFESWDRFLLPYPFGRGALVFGAPLRFEGDPRDPAALEDFRARVEDALVAATQEADRRVGREPVEPAARVDHGLAAEPVTEPA